MIVTNKYVDKTFKGDNCFLAREILSVRRNKTHKIYIIRTYRCNYIEVETGEVNENDEPILETRLKIINQKDQDYVSKYSYAEINALWNQIKNTVDFANLDYMIIEVLAETIALLEETKIAEPYGTLLTDWEMLSNEIKVIY